MLNSPTAPSPTYTPLPEPPQASNAALPRIFAVVLGMHRSGTSLVTSLLVHAGCFPGRTSDLLGAGKFNPKGYYERISVIKANDAFLEHAGGSWLSPPPADRIRRRSEGTIVTSLVSDYRGYHYAVLKDPRLCLSFPVWEPYLGDGIRIVRVIRDPHATAASLSNRFQIPVPYCIELSRIYHERANHYAARHASFTVRFESLFSKNRQRLLAALGEFLELPRDLNAIAQALIDPAMQHFHPPQENVMRLAK